MKMNVYVYYMWKIPDKFHGYHILDKEEYKSRDDYDCIIEQIVCEHIIGDVTK